MTRQPATREDGQSIVEMAILMPLVLTLVLGVVEVSYALLDQHAVIKLSREGSNLISRDVSLADAAAAIETMATKPVSFDDRGKVIFSVLLRVAVAGAPNDDQVILYRRHEMGSLAAASALTTAGAAAFGGPPNYEAVNPATNANLQLATVPESLDIPRGSLMYVTEIYSRHNLITPLDKFGITVPDRLYSIAYF